MFDLRPYQQAAVDDILDRGLSLAPGEALCYASPTGSGKSLIELSVLAQDPDCGLITNRIEIIVGMLSKMSIDTDTLSEEKLVAKALDLRITTPVRMRNMLAKGTFPFRFKRLIVDESHHATANTYMEIRAYLPECSYIFLTATPYRGTAKGTAEFLSLFNNEITEVLSLSDAVDNNYITLPKVEIWPLVDDDIIEVSNGEFSVSQCESIYNDRLDDLVHRVKQAGFVKEGRWDRPTIFSVNGTSTAELLTAKLVASGLPAASILQDTKRQTRLQLFRDVVDRKIALSQISVVSEGVDLPLRRLIDARSLMSPVAFMQQLGRITRPADTPPEYIGTNRNLARHAYLFDGLLPASSVVAAQKAFPTQSSRAGSRVVGLENLSRFKPIDVPFLDGSTGVMYQLYEFDGLAKREYAVICHPRFLDPLYATRSSAVKGDDEKSDLARITGKTEYHFGKWRRIDGLPDLQGFASVATGSCSEKQIAWWKRSARRYGLNPEIEPTRKNFCVLPVFVDLGGIPRAWRRG